MAKEYIESTGKKFYKSDPIPGDMKLRGKYRQGWNTAPHHNKHSDNQGKNRHKVANPTSYAEPRVMVMDLSTGNGRCRMMTREQFAALPWGWEIKDQIKK